MSKSEFEHTDHSGSINADEKAPAPPCCNIPEHQKRHANPTALGLCAFAVGAFMVGLYNTGLVIHLPQAIMGVALGFAGMGQFICGIADLLLGNTFGGTTMLTFSGFWFSYGIMFYGESGFLEAAIKAGMIELEKCLGLWQIAFAIPSFIFLIATLKQSWAVRLILLQVFLTFFLGGIGAFTGVTAVTKAGGWISFTLSITAWYVMAVILFAEEKLIKLPL
ncbi:GPR1/FUN34/yaaH family-domain-containing protein [Dichotomocladium elegans]|nr:GPR1/FUN34/yaaH family-domain-containing protein [Dichotomocladium elegans]